MSPENFQGGGREGQFESHWLVMKLGVVNYHHTIFSTDTEPFLARKKMSGVILENNGATLKWDDMDISN